MDQLDFCRDLLWVLFANEITFIIVSAIAKLIMENILYQLVSLKVFSSKSNRKAMNRNWSNQKANPALKTKTGNKKILQIDKIQ